MRLYLSSYKIGDKKDSLKTMIPGQLPIGFIPNAVDYLNGEDWHQSNQRNIADLEQLGIRVQVVDLKEYFGKKNALEEVLKTLGGVWVRGGNTFVLRQAMRLSGFDELILTFRDKEFLYGGYSAGICVLAPELYGLQLVDKPNIFPYPEMQEVIWEGLGMLDYLILPHYQSAHPESAMIDKGVLYCQENNIPYKTLRDGEVIVL